MGPTQTGPNPDMLQRTANRWCMTKTADVNDPFADDVSARDLRGIVEKYSQLVVKAQFVMNGGASVAVMAFIGSGAADEYLSSAVFALGFSACGVFLAALVSALSMFAAKCFYEAAQHKADPKRKKKEHDRGKRIYYTSCVCVAASAVVFLLGVGILGRSILMAAHVVATFKSSM